MSDRDDFQLLMNYDISDPPRWHYKPIQSDYFDWAFEQVAANDAIMLWRTNLAGRAYFHSKNMAAFNHRCVFGALCADWHKVADVLDKYDPLEEAVRAAHKQGAKIYAYMPMNEWMCYRQQGLDLTDPVWRYQPQHFVCSRDQSRYFMGMPCFGLPQVRARIIATICEAVDYGVDGLFLCTRSHSWRPHILGRTIYEMQEDEFGYERPVVDEYQRRHGVNIIWEDFDEDEWHRIKGEQYTEFLRMLRAALRPRNCPIILQTNTDRLRFMGQVYQEGSKCYRLYKDWERWVAEDLIDGLSVPWDRADPPTGEPHIVDISTFKETLPPDFKVYSSVALSYQDATLPASGRPFCGVEQARPKSLQAAADQARMAREAGAAGIHVGAYMQLFVDTNGAPLSSGLGPVPQPQYWQVLRG